MPLQELNYTDGAQWVLARSAIKVSNVEIYAALQALAYSAAQARADCAVGGLFPGSTLEVLLTRDLDAEHRLEVPALPAHVDASAMRAIGEAITREMKDTGKKLLTLRVEGFGEVVVFPPEMSETVLLGTKTTLLNA
ncbi:MAG: hypothetical protein ACTS6O_07080 [Giesbergeria sp.]